GADASGAANPAGGQSSIYVVRISRAPNAGKRSISESGICPRDAAVVRRAYQGLRPRVRLLLLHPHSVAEQWGDFGQGRGAGRVGVVGSVSEPSATDAELSGLTG